MNGFDIAVVAVVALSTLFAFVRGVVREVIALAAWVVGFVAALAYAGPLAGDVRRGSTSRRWRSTSLAFALILIVVLVVGALVARLLSSVVRGVGLGFVDRFLGAVFGVVARGRCWSLIFALVAGLTDAAAARLVAECGAWAAAGGGGAGAEAVAAARRGPSGSIIRRRGSAARRSGRHRGADGES